jgi:hypothetical protein
MFGVLCLGQQIPDTLFSGEEILSTLNVCSVGLAALRCQLISQRIDSP